MTQKFPLLTVLRKFWILQVDDRIYPPFFQVGDALAFCTRLKIDKFHLQSVAPTKRSKGIVH